ncbi:hypothetical protein FO519_008670, partial [Halicephalobus sp. NKZ332]
MYQKYHQTIDESNELFSKADGIYEELYERKKENAEFALKELKKSTDKLEATKANMKAAEIEEKLIQAKAEKELLRIQRCSLTEALRQAKIDENNLRHRLKVYEALQNTRKQGIKEHKSMEAAVDAEKQKKTKLEEDLQKLRKFLEEAWLQEKNLESDVERQRFVKIREEEEVLETEKTELQKELDHLRYTLVTIIFEIEFILYKPYVIMPYGIFYPFGLLGFVSPELSIFCMTIEVITIAWMLVFILWMTLERYFALKTNKKFYQKSYFYITYYSFVMGVFMTIILASIYYVRFFKSPEEVTAIVENFIEDGEVLLQHRSNLFGFPTDTNKLVLIFSGYGFLILNTSISGFAARYLSYKAIARSKTSLCHKVKFQHIVLLRLTLIQNILYITLIFLPLLT